MKPVVKKSRRYLEYIFVLILSLVVVACGGGGGGAPVTGKPDTQNINGGAVKGPLANAIVTVYVLDYSQPGFKGAEVASGTTDGSAAITDLALPLPLQPPYLFEFTSDTSTVDLTTGVAPVLSTMRTIVIDDAMLNSLVYATPLTTMATDLAVLNADQGYPYSGNSDGTTGETEFLAALGVATTQVLSTVGFGMDVNADIFRTSPLINASTTDAASQAVVVAYRTAIEAVTAVLFNMGVSAGQNADVMLAELVRDLADDVIDGQVNGSASPHISASEIAVLTDPNPGAMEIPNTTRTVDEVEAILEEEKAQTGNDSVDTSGMGSVTPDPATTDTLGAVPSVAGMTQADAETAIANAGFVVGNISSENSATVIAGNVIRQDPDTGSLLFGTTINIVVSLGPVMINVPDVTGLTQADAESAITSAGLAAGNVTSDYSTTVATGNVISQAPDSGQLPEGDPVNIVVSLGPPASSIPDVSGIYSLEFTPVGTRNCNATGAGNADYLQIIPDFIGYISIAQPGGESTIDVTYFNGVTATGTVNNNGNIVLNNAIRSWVDAHGRATQIEYDLTGIFAAGSPNTITGNIVDMTINGTANCTQTLSFKAELVYQPLGTEDYDGMYDQEMWLQKDKGFSNRELGPMQIELTDTTLTVGYFDEGYIGQASVTLTSFDRTTGVMTFSATEDSFSDIDGDGVDDDLNHHTTEGTIMLVRDPADTSGRPALIWFNFTTNEEYLNTTTYDPGNMPPANWIDNGIETSYSRRVTTVGMTRSNHVPLTGSSAEGDFVTLGILNPPLLGLDAATASIEVVEDASTDVVCTATYSSRLWSRYGMPLADMTKEAFFPYTYSWISCPVNAATREIIDSGSYTINVKDGTNATLYSYTFTATPTTFATSIPNRREVALGGARSSRTQRGDVIDLIGFFNPVNDLPVVVPASADSDIDFYRLTFRSSQGGNTRIDITSPTNSFIIPADTAIAAAAEGGDHGPGLEMRLTERYDRSGRKAQSHSRWLNIHAGIRGLVNMEVVDPLGINSPVLLQLALDGSSEVPNAVICGVTNASDTSLSCIASLDYSANRVLGTIALGGTPVIGFEIVFTDSVNGTAQINDLGSSAVWNGAARIVNPELTARSEISYSQGVLVESTYVNFLNPIPIFDRGVLSSNSGQDLGAGAATPLTLWDGDYISQFYSYLVYPLDGIQAQKNAAVMTFNTGSNGLLNADRFVIDLDHNLLDPTATLRYAVDYAAPDPNALFSTNNFPPDRPDFTVRINSVVVTANTGSFDDPIPVTESDTIELSWPDVTADSADTRWQVRMGEVLASDGPYVAHAERRTDRLDHTAPGSGLTLGGGNWAWASPADFLAGASNGSSAIVRFHVRASNVTNTIRGQSRGIHFVVTP